MLIRLVSLGIVLPIAPHAFPGAECAPAFLPGQESTDFSAPLQDDCSFGVRLYVSIVAGLQSMEKSLFLTSDSEPYVRDFQLIRLLLSAPLSWIALMIAHFEPWAIIFGSFWSTALMTTGTFDVLHSPFTGTVPVHPLVHALALPYPTIRGSTSFVLGL